MGRSRLIHRMLHSVSGDVLGTLGRSGRPLTAAEVTKLIDERTNEAEVTRLLGMWSAPGTGGVAVVLVESTPLGDLYRLNRDHQSAAAITAHF